MQKSRPFSGPTFRNDEKNQKLLVASAAVAATAAKK
jgi:hypothetical protein